MNYRTFSLSCFVAVLIIFEACPLEATAQVHPGDILVTNNRLDGGDVIQIDPQTGEQTLLNGLLDSPIGITVTPEGRILVADAVTHGSGKIYDVDPVTGDLTIVSLGGKGADSFAKPNGITSAGLNEIYVSDISLAGFRPAAVIFRVDTVTGASEIIATGESPRKLTFPGGLVTDAEGKIIVASDGPRTVERPAAVLRIDPASGSEQVLAGTYPGQVDPGLLRDPLDVAIDANGDIFVADPAAFGISGGIIRVGSSGGQLEVSSEGFFVDPFGIAIAPGGDLLVADHGANAIIRVDPATGAQTMVASGGFLTDLERITVVPESFGAITGDMDGDGDIDFDDIDAFVLGLNNPAEYENMFGVPPSLRGDTDGDGDQDFDDVSGFVSLLVCGCQQTVPEPSSISLLMVGLLGILVYRARSVATSSSRRGVETKYQATALEGRRTENGQPVGSWCTTGPRPHPTTWPIAHPYGGNRLCRQDCGGQDCGDRDGAQPVNGSRVDVSRIGAAK